MKLRWMALRVTAPHSLAKPAPSTPAPPRMQAAPRDPSGATRASVPGGSASSTSASRELRLPAHPADRVEIQVVQRACAPMPCARSVSLPPR